jgi:nitroreductase
MLRMGRAAGMPESYAAQAAASVPAYLSSFNDDQMKGWLNKQVTYAVTSMMWMAEVLGYDTAALEGFEQQKVCETLRLPMSYWVVSMLAIGKLKGPDKFDGGRFDLQHTVFGEEYGKQLK